MPPRCTSVQLGFLGAKTQRAPEVEPSWSLSSTFGLQPHPRQTSRPYDETVSPPAAAKSSQSSSRRGSGKAPEPSPFTDPALDKFRAWLQTELCTLADQLADDVGRAADRACAQLRRTCDNLSIADSRTAATVLQKDVVA